MLTVEVNFSRDTPANTHKRLRSADTLLIGQHTVVTDV
jgi:hypothetical protein